MPDKPNVTPAKTASVKGSCLCRRIQYEVHGAPTTTVLCHCDNCRRACGSCFAANSRYTKDQFTITQGEDVLSTFDDTQTDSGSTVYRSFCGTCGSQLFITHSKYTDIVVVAMGSMEGQQHGWRPEQELYSKRRLGFLHGVEGSVWHDEGEE
jgi:hypothetical protein